MRHVSTRANQTLDLILATNSLYEKKSVESYPPFGLSDHNVIILKTKRRPWPFQPASRKVVASRDMLHSRKKKLETLLKCNRLVYSRVTELLWRYASFSFWRGSCVQFASILLCLIIKSNCMHVNHQPWIELKSLIKNRQKAFYMGSVDRFKYYRIIVKGKFVVESTLCPTTL